MVKKLFIDADAFVALKDAKDSNHKLSVIVGTAATYAKTSLLTSDPAFGEAITVISQNVSHQDAVDFAQEIIGSDVDIIEVDKGLRKRGLEIFKKQTSKNTRFTDCVNMAILEMEGLKEIFSFDSDYKKSGFLRIGIDISIDVLKE